jgi:hypothetical protein
MTAQFVSVLVANCSHGGVYESDSLLKKATRA